MPNSTLPKPRPVWAITVAVWASLCTAAAIFNLVMQWWLAAVLWSVSALATWGFTVPTAIRTHRSRLRSWQIRVDALARIDAILATGGEPR
jgi:hypothetical protein